MTSTIQRRDPGSGAGASPAPGSSPRRRTGRSRLRRWATNGVVFLALMALWWAVTASNVVKPLFLPGPAAVWQAFVHASSCRPISGAGGRVQCGEQGYFLWEPLLASLERIAVGVALGAAFGVLLGFSMSTVRPLGRIMEPYLNFLRSLPPLGYIGLLIVWFGIGDNSKIWLLFLAAFPPIAMATIEGVRDIRTDRIHAAQSLGATRLQVIKYVVLPSSLAAIVSGVRIAVGFAWTTVVAAELNNGIPGIGGLAYISGTQMQTALTIACIIVIGLAAIALDAAIKYLGQILVPWQGKA